MQEIPREILIQAAGGNIEAFEEIYKAVSGFVYSLAFRITNSRNDAQEVIQDVFLKIYKNLKSFKFRSSFKTWVYRITVNTAVNAYRKTSKETRRRIDSDFTIQSKSIPPEAEKTINKEDTKVFITSLLAILSPEQRTCIILKEIEGLNYKEISGVLKININTVRSRLKRAREALLVYRKER